MNNKLLRAAIFVGLILFFIACKKESTTDTPTNPDSYVKIKMNGVWKTYTKAEGDLGPDLLDGSKTDFGVAASTENDTETFDLTLQIDGSTIVPGTYFSENYTDYYLDVSFIKWLTDPQYYIIQNGLDTEDSKYTLHITSITPTHLTGTFTGTYLYDSFASDGGILRITEGEFSVKRVR